MKLISPDQIEIAAQAVAVGALVVVPTRRWYMICANARNPEVCERVFTGKGRRRSKSLAYVIPDREAAENLFVMTSPARKLTSAFWPGDLALILAWRDLRVAEQHTAVGMPHALVTMDPGPLGALAALSPAPIAATTANISKIADTTAAGPAITIAEVKRFAIEAGLDIAYCVDGGICPLAQHLTIIDCTTPEAQITRSGVVHERAINAALTSDPPRIPISG